MSLALRIILALYLCSTTLLSQPRIVKLDPPQISVETISEKLVCTRPMREGKFNISLEKHQNKTVINCYGHGGSGWTTLFGSVHQAVKLYQETNPDPKTPIRVIGSGCMGLTTAIELAKLGYNVVGISTKSLYDMASWRAAGYFALVSIKTSPEEEANLNEINLNTFMTYQKIDQGLHPYITKDAVKFIPAYCSVDTEAGVEELEERGLIPQKEYVSLDFGNGVIHHNFVKYMTYFMDTTSLMKQLTNEVRQQGIPIEVKKIHSFDQVSEGVIFNCSGLGGRELNHDESIIPVRGHLITLKNQVGTSHMDYMIYTKVKQDGKEEYIYMFPKSLSITSEHKEGVSCTGVLGGTFIPHVDKLSRKEQEELDRKEFQRLLDRNSIFFLGHPFSDIVD